MHGVLVRPQVCWPAMKRRRWQMAKQVVATRSRGYRESEVQKVDKKGCIMELVLSLPMQYGAVPCHNRPPTAASL